MATAEPDQESMAPAPGPERDVGAAREGSTTGEPWGRLALVAVDLLVVGWMLQGQRGSLERLDVSMTDIDPAPSVVTSADPELVRQLTTSSTLTDRGTAAQRGALGQSLDGSRTLG